jgi:hydroxymethylpyrimidine kinase / phosphomethylpyrimidine kinase / thiamine-phosphate diphosphorylase
MPWHAQGLHNLRWWQHMASAPVVAIGGILTPAQVQEAASCGVDGVCIVRGLGDEPQSTVPAMQRALEFGAEEVTLAELPMLPHPTLTA